MEALHQRTELLLGTPTMEALKSTRVILFGVGGVGGGGGAGRGDGWGERWEFCLCSCIGLRR